MNGMIKRTKEAQDQGDSYMPLTAVFVDDLAAGSGPSEGYRFNDALLKLFTTSRHSGGVCIVLSQSYKPINRGVRLQASHLALFAVQESQKTRSL